MSLFSKFAMMLVSAGDGKQDVEYWAVYSRGPVLLSSGMDCIPLPDTHVIDISGYIYLKNSLCSAGNPFLHAGGDHRTRHGSLRLPGGPHRWRSRL